MRISDWSSDVCSSDLKGFKPVALTGVKANFSFDNEISKKMSRNVIGILPGAKRPDEYVLYTGHWDHLGRCTPVDGDDICNGAVDNASGIAGLVTLAEAHKQAGAPDRRDRKSTRLNSSH